MGIENLHLNFVGSKQHSVSGRAGHSQEYTDTNGYRKDKRRFGQPSPLSWQANKSFIDHEWTRAPFIASSLVSMMLRLPKLKFAIVTLGEEGCVMLERSSDVGHQAEEADVDCLLEILKQQKDDSMIIPTCVASSVTKLRADGIGTVRGRLLLGTAEKIPLTELVDTAGAVDAFIGATLFGDPFIIFVEAICASMPPERMLPFAAQVAAANCRALGARTSLPYRTDPHLATFLS
ncbi:uncharacterized protein LOC116213705 [Punica granatum]|uniref:Uncharacterized protein n=2 Tax=Punica granatum TaxID=22663 RepID=A0A2I0L832_PUNGR|nr:uncharacterized protein LOC116213705 [Punica granatum]PKI76845.1 hypothetical protein CRG98_002831 [Punica granatum]